MSITRQRVFAWSGSALGTCGTARVGRKAEVRETVCSTGLKTRASEEIRRRGSSREAWVRLSLRDVEDLLLDVESSPPARPFAPGSAVDAKRKVETRQCERRHS